jgi:hypothetical protein
MVGPDPLEPEWLGSLRGTLELQGEVVAPSGDLVRWEARTTRLDD